MAADWGCLVAEDDDGASCWHVLPLIELDGEMVPVWSHDASSRCHCGPFPERAAGGWNVWFHCDPDHPGAMTPDEFWQRKRTALAVKPTIQREGN